MSPDVAVAYVQGLVKGYKTSWFAKPTIDDYEKVIERLMELAREQLEADRAEARTWDALYGELKK